MTKIIELPFLTRGKFEFKIIRVLSKDIDGGNGWYPAVCLFEKETDKLVCYTGLEQYLLSQFSKPKRYATLEGYAKSVVRFMNYLLQHEKIDGVQEVDKEILRRYQEYIKVQNDGTEMSYDSWKKHIAQVYQFLIGYYRYNFEKTDFNYEPEILRESRTHLNARSGKPATQDTNGVFTRPPRQKAGKCRYLPKDFLEMWLFELKMHDPEMYFPMMLQAYSGVREGGVLNLSRNSFHLPQGFGNITLDIEVRSSFVKEDTRKTPIGAIKKYRKQDVYPDFTDIVKVEYIEHLKREEAKFKRLGKKIKTDDPLFTNSYGNPLRYHNYNERCKKVFEEHFVPDLEAYCVATGQYDQHKALIDAYKRDWIGCHSMRHWFSMYLKVYKKLDDTQVMVWRGDDNKQSYLDYMHQNADAKENFMKVAFHFQVRMWEAIKDK